MKVERDKKADAVYIYLDETPGRSTMIAYSVKLTPDIILDYTADDRIVGIDLQQVSQMLEAA